MIPDYALLSPVGETRLYALEQFFKHIDRFSPKPAQTIVCVDSETDLEMDRLRIAEPTRLHGNEKLRLGYLPRIADAREKLRRYFLRNTDLDWALWIDSDILAPPELPGKLLQVAEERNAILICNGYPGRSREGLNWHGSGCMLTNRIACDVGRFLVVDFDIGGHRMNISEDYNFFSLITGAASLIKQYTGKECRISGDFVVVKHWMNKEELK